MCCWSFHKNHTETVCSCLSLTYVTAAAASELEHAGRLTNTIINQQIVHGNILMCDQFDRFLCTTSADERWNRMKFRGAVSTEFFQDRFTYRPSAFLGGWRQMTVEFFSNLFQVIHIDLQLLSISIDDFVVRQRKFSWVPTVLVVENIAQAKTEIPENTESTW